MSKFPVDTVKVGFPLGDIKLITVSRNVVACTKCHVVYCGEELLGRVGRYDDKEPISGWILCRFCRCGVLRRCQVLR